MLTLITKYRILGQFGYIIQHSSYFLLIEKAVLQEQLEPSQDPAKVDLAP